MKTYSTKLVISIVAFIVLIGAICAVALRSGSSQSAQTPDNTPATTTPDAVAVSTSTAATPSKYKDGTYEAVGSYESPGGLDNLDVTLTLKSGTVTAATVAAGAHDPESSRYQRMFIGGINALIVGKSIDALAITKVSGSSLTPRGFNDALTQIKAKAQA